MRVKTLLGKWLFFFVAVILLTITIIDGCNYPIKVTQYEEFKTEIDRQIPVLMKKYNVCGAAVALVHDSSIDMVKGYGLADKKNLIPVNENTIFQVASNSKTVAAWGAMKLVEDNVLALDLPVSSYLTRWKLPDSKYDKEEVTIRQLLSHTAGLSAVNYAGYLPENELPSIEESLSGTVKSVRKLKLISEPGVKYRYSGGGYTLLQLIIEETTGKPFTQYMKDTVLTTLNMSSSSYKWDTKLKNETAKAYDIFGLEMPNYIYTEEAAAGLYTTASDFAYFIKANIDIFNGNKLNNDLLKNKSLEIMYTPVDEDYGLGYIIKKLPNSTRLIYHGGTNRGWRSQFAILPEMGEGLVVLTNSETGKHLHSDLVAIWTKWQTGFTPKAYIKDIVLRILVKAIAFVLLAYLCLLACQIIKNVFIDKKLFSRKNRLKLMLMLNNRKKLLLVFSLLFALVAWIVVFYTGLLYNGWTFASFMPAGFNILSIAVLLTIIVTLLRVVFKLETDLT